MGSVLCICYRPLAVEGLFTANITVVVSSESVTRDIIVVKDAQTSVLQMISAVALGILHIGSKVHISSVQGDDRHSKIRLSHLLHSQYAEYHSMSGSYLKRRRTS